MKKISLLATLMQRIGFCLAVLMCAVAPLLTSCEENLDEDNKYVNWKARNSEAFLLRLSEAKQAIAQAQAQYGTEWEKHCKWRLFRTYCLPEEAPANATDTVCVEIIEAGTGSGYPLYTDSVRVNYLGRLISTDLEQPLGTLGEPFDHSGYSSDPADVFDPRFAVPATFLVSNTVEGFTTVLQHMRIGDLWRAYIPQELGYASAASAALPAYSMLIFDVQLKSYYRAGAVPPNWK